MCRMQIIAILLVLPVSFAALGQASEKAEAKCSGGSSHAKISFCINTEANESDEKVLLKEAEVIDGLNKWNMDIEPKRVAIEKFKSAASQFKVWRNVQCNAKAALALGGSGSDPLYDLCRIEINEYRVLELMSYKKELDSRN